MSEYEEAYYALLKIFEIIESGNKTKKSDWAEIMECLSGKNDAETVKNIQQLVKKNFSFQIADGAEGYVYYGELEGDTRVWKVVVCK